MKRKLVSTAILTVLLICPIWTYACEAEVNNLGNEIGSQGGLLSEEDLAQVKALLLDAMNLCNAGDAIGSLDNVNQAYLIFDAYPDASATTQ